MFMLCIDIFGRCQVRETFFYNIKYAIHEKKFHDTNKNTHYTKMHFQRESQAMHVR